MTDQVLVGDIVALDPTEHSFDACLNRYGPTDRVSNLRVVRVYRSGEHTRLTAVCEGAPYQVDAAISKFSLERRPLLLA